MNILACIDGGLLCVPLAIATACGFGWCVRCFCKHILKKDFCNCKCHDEHEPGEYEDEAQ